MGPAQRHEIHVTVKGCWSWGFIEVVYTKAHPLTTALLSIMRVSHVYAPPRRNTLQLEPSPSCNMCSNLCYNFLYIPRSWKLVFVPVGPIGIGTCPTKCISLRPPPLPARSPDHLLAYSTNRTPSRLHSEISSIQG
jgi:hypothetical protein